MNLSVKKVSWPVEMEIVLKRENSAMKKKIVTMVPMKMLAVISYIFGCFSSNVDHISI